MSAAVQSKLSKDPRQSPLGCQKRKKTVLAAAMALPEAVASLSTHPLLKDFLTDGLDTAAFANKTLGSRSSATAAHALSEGISGLEQSLRAEVVSRHEELLEQLSGCAGWRPCAAAQEPSNFLNQFFF